MIGMLDNSKIYLELIVPSNWLSWLKKYMHFSVNIAELEQNFSAQVKKIIPKVDPISQTIKIIAEANDTKKQLISGMNGKAYFDKKKTV